MKIKQILILLIALPVLLTFANCQSTNKKKVGSQEVVMHDKATLSFFGGNTVHIDDCVKDLEKEGVNEVLAASGRSCYGIFGMTCKSESTATTATPACSATGLKK